MTLTIDVTPEQEGSLQAQAQAQGIELQDFLRQCVFTATQQNASIRPFGPNVTAVGESAGSPRKSAPGKFVGVSPSVDNFLAEKHAEIAREDAIWAKDSALE